jgi:hypothetical protein
MKNGKKVGFAAASAVLLAGSAILCAWMAWHYLTATSSQSTPADSNVPAPAPSAPELPATEPPTPADHEPGEKFLGVWTGHWDNKLPAKFNITRLSAKQLQALYEAQEIPGQPIVKKTLHPFANDKALDMPRASATLILSEAVPNTARGVLTMKVDGNPIIRTATFVRGGDRQIANWLADQQSTAPTDPVILDIKATIDGSDQLTINSNGAVWTHNDFQWPMDITVNGIPWDAHTQPALTDVGLRDVNFSTCQVLSRKARDSIDMKATPDGITITFNDDATAGFAPYEIRLSLARGPKSGR